MTFEYDSTKPPRTEEARAAGKIHRDLTNKEWPMEAIWRVGKILSAIADPYKMIE